MNNILIEIKGGNIQRIFSHDCDVSIHVIDYDNIEAGDGLDLSPLPFNCAIHSFREFYTDIHDPLTQEIHNELQMWHL